MQRWNAGIGDAINLAWKLAAVLKDGAADTLLDSFDQERPAFARRLVATTDRGFSLVTAQGCMAEFMRTSVVPLFVKFAWQFHPTREALFRVVSQTMLHYRDSALSAGKAGTVHGGDRMPYVKFDGGDNFGFLSQIAWQVQVYGAASGELRQWCARRRVALHEFAWRDAFDKAGLVRDAAYLLRPDSYVALAEPMGRATELETYLFERGLKLDGIPLTR